MKRSLFVFLLTLALIFSYSFSVFAEKSDYVFDGTYTESNPLGVGEHTLTLSEEANNTLFVFSPDEIGVYTFTVDDGAYVGWWGAYSIYVRNPGSTESSIECEIKSVGNSAIIGISSDSPSVKLKIEKTGESEGIIQIDYIDYENEHTPVAGLYPPSGAVSMVDITVPHRAVLNADGSYRLDYEDGPRLFIDLYSGGFNLANAYGAYGALTMRGECDGVFYDFKSAMKEYNEVLKGTSGIYPLTVDLIRFVQSYGERQQWFDVIHSPFEEIRAGTADADTAWMVACCTEHGDIGKELVEISDTDKSTPYIIEYTTESQSAGSPISYSLGNKRGNTLINIIGSKAFSVSYDGDSYMSSDNKVTIEGVAANAVITINGEGVFTIEANTHTVCSLKFVDEIPATHTKSGQKEYWVCDICAKKFDSNKSGASELIGDDLVIYAKGHIGALKVERKEPSCTAEGNIEYWHCSACEANYDGTGVRASLLSDEEITLPKPAHTRGPVESNEDGHVFKCASCGTPEPRSEHSLDEDEICTVCGFKAAPTGFWATIGNFFKNIFLSIKNFFVNLFT